jgi:hypothetical protein
MASVPLDHLLFASGGGNAHQPLDRGNNGSERIAELMAKHRQELILPAGGLQDIGVLKRGADDVRSRTHQDTVGFGIERRASSREQPTALATDRKLCLDAPEPSAANHDQRINAIALCAAEGPQFSKLRVRRWSAVKDGVTLLGQIRPEVDQLAIERGWQGIKHRRQHLFGRTANAHRLQGVQGRQISNTALEAYFPICGVAQLCTDIRSAHRAAMLDIAKQFFRWRIERILVQHTVHDGERMRSQQVHHC